MVEISRGLFLPVSNYSVLALRHSGGLNDLLYRMLQNLSDFPNTICSV